MDHQTSGQLSQPSHASSYQWLSFAYQGLTEIPYETILTQTDTLEVLDLSYNLLDEFPRDYGLRRNWKFVGLDLVSFHQCLTSRLILEEYVPERPRPNSLEILGSVSLSSYWNPALLGRLEKLSTLILDCNRYTSHVKFPFMPSVTTLCINKNKINNLPVFVEEVRRKFPGIKILSMMNNEAAPSYFNGGSLTQYIDYRQYVISQIPGLEILDDTEVLEKERVQARKTYRLQQSRHSSRKRKDDSSRKHAHIGKKSNTVV